MEIRQQTFYMSMAVYKSILRRCVCTVVGCYSQNYEDEETIKTSAAVGRSPQSAICQIPSASSCHQGRYYLYTLVCNEMKTKIPRTKNTFCFTQIYFITT